jgi:Eco47II restriction endonuclease
MMASYSLGFISDVDFFEHVKNTVSKYRFSINIKDFNKNLIDPIKLTFDSEIYKLSIEELIDSEIIRQIDKSNNNHIGYFHQNIFKYIKSDWVVPKKGFDIVNEKEKIYVEMKNKHNTMNSSSSQKTYMRMQDKIIKDEKATCMLVEIIAKNSQNSKWQMSLDGTSVSNDRIRRLSIDKFYKIVTGDPDAFKNLCVLLPKVISDVVRDIQLPSMDKKVFDELKGISSNLLKSIYLLSFKKYEGFDSFDIDCKNNSNSCKG